MITKKILLLDDNQDIMEMMKEAMLSEGYDVEGMTSTTNIICTVLSYRPDLVLMDYLLTGINGGEFCHQIKTHPETSHIPVVMVSAYPRVLQSLGNYGSDAFIAKPFSLEELTGCVKGLLLAS
jgi:CheY-like chemotaxis protein